MNKYKKKVLSAQFRNSRTKGRRYAYGLDFLFSGINFKQCISIFVFHNNL